MILLKDTYFDLFHLPEHFEIDLFALNSAYRTIQKQVHPDRFVAASDMQKHIAMQWTTHTNEAYRTLCDPLNRAIYILSIHSIDMSAKNKIAMDPKFLAQQMEWYNVLEDLFCKHNISAIIELLEELKNEENIRFDKVRSFLSYKKYQAAYKFVRQIIFIRRVISEANSKISSCLQSCTADDIH
ncbi:MAG: Fe-S protein assembly co-chaperone HscB [Burkholderia sp.]|nr:Fe-S protein assembly co-chaperone HscB [Burkholderia sp.]